VATFKLEGFKELDRALGEIPKRTGKNALRRVLRKAAEPILDDMKANAPRDTGVMATKIAQSGTLTGNERKGHVAEFLGIGDSGQKIFGKQDAKNFVEIHVGATGKKQNSPIPMWIEYGTFDTSPNPFMRPAWESNKDRALNIIKVELKGEIEKAAKRYAKKLAKGTA
jgi:HK97 gp10 family phage protein